MDILIVEVNKMKKMWMLIAPMLILLSFFQFIVSGKMVSNFSVTLDFEENNGRMIYFDVSENNKLCISYDNDQVYEYDFNGKFIRSIEYETNGNIYAYYKNENLVINDIRKNLHIVIDENNFCVESFESNNTNSGFYIADSCNEGIKFTKNLYEYQYVNADWFARVFENKKTHISVRLGDETIIKIEENTGIIYDFAPVIFIFVLVPTLLFLKKMKNLKQKFK